ncbi:hypothetical protein LHL03_11080 [Pectobacterium carotovorum]|uniref:hypothetical protein n=1 Tax=Pectobacterium carotovorum TaxID=554 RepID=UPI0010FE6C55|nr:hypothetical protein [Pectobacterium carotovorum]KAA3668307.1 hypothetical protein FEV48_08020 [Pectobacterium carotovorum subsp. carotovorum]UCZ77637.1 hypothetical protein LHL03_11080 [Pectobacterium carotovorum]
MKKHLFPILLALASQSHAAGTGVDFELKSVAVPDALSVFYTQILKKPFRLSPDVVSMPEKISFRLMPEQDARQFLVDYMADIGVGVKTKNGTDFFYKPVQVEKKTPQFSYTYRPLYRSPEFLAAQLKTLVDDGARFAQGEGANPDSLVFYGSRADIRRISR